MSETVTDIIVSRSREPEGLSSMVALSVTAHVVFIGLVLLLPYARPNDGPRTVMTISLGGAPGPKAGGLTQLGGQNVPPPPPEPTVKREEPLPTPPKQAMALPDARKTPRALPARQTDTSRSKPATTQEPQEGVTRTDTGARGQGFGLSSGGGGAKGVELDVANFCCPEYLEQMVTLIQRNWNPKLGATGSTVMQFTILRDGSIQAVMLERSSGFVVLDNGANRALLLTQRLPPLPTPFPNPTLTVHMRFEYSR